MIDKVTPRKLDTSTDARFRDKTSMFYAHNVDTSDDFSSDDAGGGGGASGNLGVLKPKRGNTAITQPENLFSNDSNKRVIGSVTDNRNNVIYFFVFSDIATEQGVYAYDPNNFLNLNSDVVAVHTSALFNFPSNGFVKADIVYASNFPKGCLYFTDNVNEPRRLVVDKALGYTTTTGANLIHETDFITACPKTPMHPIRAEFENDPNRDNSNFEGVDGFQFAYQCIYNTGEESAISTYSNIYVPPAYLEQGANPSPNISANKVCKLRIPRIVNGVRVFSNEISSIRILGRRGGKGIFSVIDEIELASSNAAQITYDFYNDRVLTAIPEEDQQKQFDSLPKKASAQAVVNNRLFYGDYVEGFDEPNVDASFTVVYSDAVQDDQNIDVEITPVVFFDGAEYINYQGGNIQNIALSDSWRNGLDYVPNKKAGYRIDTSNVPNNFPAGTTFNFTLKVKPDKNFHVYNTKSDTPGSNTHHVSGEFFPQPQGIVTDQFYRQSNSHLSSNGHFFGDTPLQLNEGSVTVSEAGGNNTQAVDLGTCGSSPIIIPGGALTYTISASVSTEIASGGREKVRNLIYSVFSGEEPPSEFNVILSEPTSSYSFNLGLGDDDDIEVMTGNDYRKDLIFSVKKSSDPYDQAPPAGYFVLNQGQVTASLKPETSVNEASYASEDAFLSLSLDELQVFSTRTCHPVFYSTPSSNFSDETGIETPTLGIDKWKVYSAEYLTSQTPPVSYDSTGNWYFWDANQINTFNLITNFLDIHDLSERRFAATSVLSLPETISFTEYSIVDGNCYYLNVFGIPNDVLGPDEVSDPDQIWLDYGDLSTSTNAYRYGSIQPNNILFSRVTDNLLVQSVDFIYNGNSYDANFTGESILNISTYIAPALVTQGNIYNFGFNLSGSSIIYDDDGNLTGGLYASASAVEIADQSVFIGDASFLNAQRSFKSKANHDFGIVYYDERGRSGTVNYLGSAYVAGYSEIERPNSQQGKANVLIDLQHNPPSWAHHYQIVYAGNSSVSDFIQYTAGGAFIATNNESEDGNIYVSLNYLQNNSTASYANGFGATNPQGGNDLYTFKKGDRLRIISYYGGDVAATKFYPQDHEYQIIDSVVLSDNPDDNPLYVVGEEDTENTVPKAKTGQFLVLRDNASYTGFTYNDISNGDNSVNSNSHRWNNRCLIEIYTPLTKNDSDEKVYYETGNVYNVIKDSSGNLIHQTDSILISTGDVWWRRIALNWANYNDNTNTFNNIIQSSSSSGNFVNGQVESATFTDVIPNGDVNIYGKAKIVDKRSKEVRRDTSITYSDLNNYSTSLIRFTSFNGSKLPYKDVPSEHGRITYILNYDDSIFCIQEDKCSAIPVERSILSTASGQESLISVEDVLGTQRFYSGMYGCDGHPESVVKIGNNIYFASEAKQEIVRFNPSNGLYPISETGMKSFFRRLFIDTDYNRIVGGHDPLRDEYVISFLTLSPLTASDVTQYVQPLGNTIDEGAFVDIPGGTDVDQGGDTVAPDPEDGTGGVGDGDGTGGTGGGGIPSDWVPVDIDGDSSPDVYVANTTYASVFEGETLDTNNDNIPDTFVISATGFSDFDGYIETQAEAIIQDRLDNDELFDADDLDAAKQEAAEAARQEALDDLITTLAGSGNGYQIEAPNFTNALQELDLIIRDLEDQIESGSTAIQSKLDETVLGIYNDYGLLFWDILFNLTDENGDSILSINTLPEPLRSFLQTINQNQPTPTTLEVLLDQFLENSGVILQEAATTIFIQIQGAIDKLISAIQGDENDGVTEFASIAFNPNLPISFNDAKAILYNNTIRRVNNEWVIGSGNNVVPLNGSPSTGFTFDYGGQTFVVNAPNLTSWKVDINDDGVIGSSDLLELLGAFGATLTDQDLGINGEEPTIATQ